MNSNNSNSNGESIGGERYHSFGRGGAGNLRRPSDSMYPESRRLSLSNAFSTSGANEEGRERRRSSILSAFSGSVGESEGGGRRRSSVWKNAAVFLGRRKESTVEVVEVAVEE
ncbi:hypothetical protein FGG08_004554 [Glutinoglossum americanum]|uniref:Uncharacterized protein n=1 Tax=Glutinoglossum americanum TaxID=1670608 RepID=A0A9P8I7B9_9PEZI|nr:hypothetical protein FGG08_004554 [Glutinoglossum americanum]